MIDKLRKINNDLLFHAKTEEEKRIYEIIKNILKDDSCFLKMNMDDAYGILRDLKIKEDEIDNMYILLMSNCTKKILEKK